MAKTAAERKAAAQKRRKRPPGSGKRGPVKGDGGRPPIVLTTKQTSELQRLAEVGATRWEMAARLGIDENTLAARIRDTSSVDRALKAGEAALKVSLRRKQVMIALEDGHPSQSTMLVWLGKTTLGQSDRVSLKIETPEDAASRLKSLFPDLSEEDMAALSGEEGGRVH